MIEIGSPVIFDITYTPYKPRKDFNDNELKKWQENRVFYNMTGTNNIYRYISVVLFYLLYFIILCVKMLAEFFYRGLIMQSLSFIQSFLTHITGINAENAAEKLLPLMIANIRDGKNLPVYGKGDNIRDWIYVEDHNRAVWQIVNSGKTGEKYNIGGENEWQNIKLLHKIIELTAPEVEKKISDVENTIIHVKDRPGHDARYAIDCTKIKSELGWERKMTFEQGLKLTVDWYLSHPEWVDHILSGEYKN